ncbi:LacI family DNA-binding transcriptional regulator [Candidatus Leptofilum sp.]|uniref:LacI family DNA-binding transcriptional regulator n=1 Tax=Candidatus Leptofilum sp. TaxID=3241576 RepID=UPI003B5A6AF8
MANTTIRDVAKKAGVGVGTVSRVINRNPAVRESTRQKVLAAIEELEFTPSPIARRLSLGKTMTVAVIAPFFVRPSYVERFRGLDTVFAESDYDFVLYNVETIERRDYCFKELARSDKVDGLLIMSLVPQNNVVRRFQNAGIPTVLVDAAHPELSHIIIDDFEGGYNATKHLINLGHRYIAYISDHMHESPFNFQPVIDRYRGYRQALADADIPYKPEYHRQGELSREVAKTMTIELLQLPEPPTAVFAYSDTQAFGALRAARELNIAVPEQLSIIGYDDIEIAEYLHLTTIRQELYDSGKLGAQMLLKVINNPTAEPDTILLPTTLIERGTTAPLPIHI